jgi:hypothetical protein
VNDRELEASQRDLLETYKRIGVANPGTEVWETDLFVACRSAEKHPVSNFAVSLSLQGPTVEQLLSWGSGRANYLIYGFSSAEEPVKEGWGRSYGLRHTNLLAMLAWQGESAEPALDIRLEEERSRRLEVTRFMATQFFPLQTVATQEVIALATEGSGIDLVSAWWKGEWVGAAMLSRTDELFGIYNLCIAEGRRETGLGRALVRTLQALAVREKRWLSLQCEPRLTAWYESMDFHLIAKVDIWGVDTKKSAVIMR